VLESIYYDRGHDVPDVGPERVLTLDLQGQSSQKLKPLPETWGPAVGLVPPEGAVERQFVLDEHEVDDGQDVVFTINDQAFPDVPPVVAREGDVEVWSFDNQSAMDHPFHLHGMFFRVLDVDGVEPEHVGWKDTVNIPQKSKLRFAVEYGEPGTWMYHCHILEHQERGMMGALQIVAGDAAADSAPVAASACMPGCDAASVCCVDAHGHLPRCAVRPECPAGLMPEGE
jgi:FtsP/CotA-like multicopper oxidase with cupredoxin domain